MRKKRTNYPMLLSLIFTCLSTITPFLYTRSLLMGMIQFPRMLKKVPAIRVYYGGKIVNSYTHEGIPKVTFEVSKNNHQTVFYLLVTEHIQYRVKTFSDLSWQSNTIDYLQLPPNQQYKFYRLELVPDAIESMDNMEPLKQPSTSAEQNNSYYWKVYEEQLPENGKIPDETIVVCYFPNVIAIFSGGSKLELPAIVIKHNVIDLMGSEEKLHEASVKLQIASLDTDTIHTPTKREIKQDYQCTLIINNIT